MQAPHLHLIYLFINFCSLSLLFLSIAKSKKYKNSIENFQTMFTPICFNIKVDVKHCWEEEEEEEWGEGIKAYIPH